MADFNTNQDTPRQPYIGRFAPSPTGRLHFGSLVAALASYLDAKANQGAWLLRMEDIDPPRAERGAADSILHSLEAHHLFWDKDVLYQSTRLEAYQSALDQLKDKTYPCSCNRQRILDLGGRYDGHCLKSAPRPEEVSAIRLRTDQLTSHETAEAASFIDLYLGEQSYPLEHSGDFIIRRKDGLFAYQLAVVVDDRFQNITHVIRGHDLIDSTSRQRYLHLLLNQVCSHQLTLPEYGHTPLVLGKDGDKLSKQTKATPIDNQNAASNLLIALRFLNHPPPIDELDQVNCEELLAWATLHWQRHKVPTQAGPLPLSNTN